MADQYIGFDRLKYNRAGKSTNILRLIENLLDKLYQPLTMWTQFVAVPALPNLVCGCI